VSFDMDTPDFGRSANGLTASEKKGFAIVEMKD
jgi:hypothetical protein